MYDQNVEIEFARYKRDIKEAYEEAIQALVNIPITNDSTTYLYVRGQITGLGKALDLVDYYLARMKEKFDE